MTERQHKLMPYVDFCAEEVMNRKEKEGIIPQIASDAEIIYGIRDDITECMRELCRQKKYKGVNTLNRPALMRKEI